LAFLISIISLGNKKRKLVLQSLMMSMFDTLKSFIKVYLSSVCRWRVPGCWSTTYYVTSSVYEINTAGRSTCFALRRDLCCIRLLWQLWDA